jgi:hypothetical protein
MRFHAGDVTPDSFLDVLDRLLSRPPLGVAARQLRATRYDEPIFVRFEGYRESYRILSFPLAMILRRIRALDLCRRSRWPTELFDCEPEPFQMPIGFIDYELASLHTCSKAKQLFYRIMTATDAYVVFVQSAKDVRLVALRDLPDRLGIQFPFDSAKNKSHCTFFLLLLIIYF